MHNSVDTDLAPKTISIVLPDLRGGGAERVNLELAKGFVRRGLSVEFVLRNARGELLDEAEKIGAIVDLKAPRVRSVVQPLTGYIRRRRPTAILASLWPLTAITVWARARAHHPCSVVCAEHGMLSRQYAGRRSLHSFILRHSLRYATRQADNLVGVSKGVVDDLAQLTGYKPDRFTVIYNPVPEPVPPTEQARTHVETLWGGGQGKRIVTVGTFKDVKNQALLIDALAQLEDQEARLMLVGEGDLRADLQKRAAEKGLADRVIFAGFQTELDAFYASADVFALASWREGFGNVIVEAMNHGLKIVSTDCPTGPHEILDGGDYGRLTHPGDVAQMAAAITAALSAPADPERQKARAAEFRPDVAVNAYLSLLLPELSRTRDG